MVSVDGVQYILSPFFAYIFVARKSDCLRTLILPRLNGWTT